MITSVHRRFDSQAAHGFAGGIPGSSFPEGARLKSDVDRAAGWGGRPRPRPTPWSAFFLVEKIGVSLNYPGMALYRRRLPHDYETDQPVFLTWRLHDSLPRHRAFPAATVHSGQAFAAMDRLLDETRSGPFYLRQPAIADMVAEALTSNTTFCMPLWSCPTTFICWLLQPWHCRS